MKGKRKFFWIVSVLMVLVLGLQLQASAASVKINKKNISMAVGMSSTLKISGTKKKVKWSSSNKAVASVSENGVVTAKKKGNAVIKAKVNNKTYSCKVKVYKNSVQYKVSDTNWGNDGLIQYKVLNMSFSKNGDFKIKIRFFNNSFYYDYTIRNFRLSVFDKNQSAFLDQRLNLTNPFLLRSRYTHDLTLSVKKKELIKVVDLTKITPKYFAASIDF